MLLCKVHTHLGLGRVWYVLLGLDLVLDIGTPHGRLGALSNLGNCLCRHAVCNGAMVDRPAPGLCLRPLFHGTLPLLALLIRDLRRRSRSSTPSASVCDASTTAALLRCASWAASSSTSCKDSCCKGCAWRPCTVPWLKAARRLMCKRIDLRGSVTWALGWLHTGARNVLCIVNINGAVQGSSGLVNHPRCGWPRTPKNNTRQSKMRRYMENNK